MCELFGVDSAKKIPLNELLENFFRMEQNIPTVGVWHFLRQCCFFRKAATVCCDKQLFKAETSC